MFTWSKWESQTVQYTIPESSVSGCPVTYEVTDVNYERTSASSLFSIVSVDSTTNEVQGVWTDDPEDRFYYVRAILTNHAGTETIAIDEQQYHISIYDPCIASDVITS